MKSSSSAMQSFNLFLLLQRKFLTSLCVFPDFLQPLFCVAISAFGRFVSHVVSMCTKKQMFRICALWVVTFVKNVHALWNRAKMQHPRYTASGFFFCHAANADHSVAPGFSSKPQPAFVSFLYFRPKSLFKRRCHNRTGLLQAPHYNQGA